MREIIAKVAQDIRSVDSAYSIEEITRYVVAQVMEDEDRILEDDEILEIAEDVVRGEDIPVVEEKLEDGVARMTDIEWENVPDERKVVDTDGDSAVIIEGKVVKVVLTESKKAERIANKISKEIEGSFNLFNEMNGTKLSYDAYHFAMDVERDFVCPECGSTNVNPVWYDAEDVVLNCAECDYEWSEPIEGEELSIEDATTETYDLLDGVSGVIHYDPDEQKFGYDIWVDGECVHAGFSDSADEVYAIFDALQDSYEVIAEGLIIKDAETGESETVEFVDGDEVETSERTAKRMLIAYELAAGKKVADKSETYVDKVYVGDVYRDKRGNEMEVITASLDDVTYINVEWDDTIQDYRNEYRTQSLQAFLANVADKGYELR